jgi:hypothetical protein
MKNRDFMRQGLRIRAAPFTTTREVGVKPDDEFLTTDHESPITSLCYGWIWSVQRNCQVAIALIATDTAKSETSGTDNFVGPLPVSKRNIQGSKIMA